MNLFQYPNSNDHPLPDWAGAWNAKVEADSFQRGSFGLAMDVWRGDGLLFSTYTEDQSETCDSFHYRNYPQITHYDPREGPMGVQVAGLDRFRIPTKLAFDRGLSLAAIREIIVAALNTAQWPFTDDPVPVPSTNAIRTRISRSERDWTMLGFHWPDHDIVIRAVIGKTVELDAAESTYQVAFAKRDNVILEGDRQPMETNFVAETADLSSMDQRRAIVRMAKQLVGLTGANGKVIVSNERTFTFRAGDQPYNFTVTRTADQPQETPALIEIGLNI